MVNLERLHEKNAEKNMSTNNNREENMNKDTNMGTISLSVEVDKVDFTAFRNMKAVQKSIKRFSDRAGVLTVINSKSNGKRLELGKEVVKALGITDSESIYIACTNDMIAFSKSEIFEGTNEYMLKKSGSRRVIYCASLVYEISDIFELDFSDKVCHTLQYGFFQMNNYSKDGNMTLVITKADVCNSNDDNTVDITEEQENEVSYKTDLRYDNFNKE